MAKRRIQSARQKGYAEPPSAGRASGEPGSPDSGSASGRGTVPGSRTVTVAAVGLGFAAFVLYVLTLAPSLPAGDSGELIASAWVLGVAHPPGYPLFTMLSHLFGLLPFGEPAWRMNLMSAVLDAATVAVVVVLIHRLTAAYQSRDAESPAPRWAPLVAGALGGGVLAVSSTFWAYSLVAEVFALNNLFAALLLLVLLAWHRRPGRTRLLWLFALLSGLAFANQQTIVLLAPAFLVLLISGWRTLHRTEQAVAMRPGAAGSTREAPSWSLWGLPARTLLLAPVFLLLALLPYLYLPLAASGNPPMNWQDPDTLDRFLSVVTRAAYGTFRLTATDTSGSVIEHLALLVTNLFNGLSPVTLLLAVAGGWWLWIRSRAVAGALLLAFVVAGPGFVAYANAPIDSSLTKGVLERFYILPSIPLVILAGAGIVPLLAFVAWATGGRWSGALVRATAAALLVLPIGLGAMHYGSVDHSRDRTAADYGLDMLEWLESDALLIMRGDHNYTATSWAQFVEDVRPDVVVLEAEMLKTVPYVGDRRARYPGVTIPFPVYDDGATAHLADLVAANIGQRPVYYIGLMKEEGWTAGYDEVRAGLTRRLLPKGTGGDPNAALRADLRRYLALRFPEKRHPDTSWEWLMDKAYGAAAFDVAFAQQGEGTAAEDRLAEELYRTSLRLDPDRAVTYKNLGLLLFDRGGDLTEVANLWERYLAMNPEDPQADQIKGQLDDIRKTLP
jgi:hypothetical protein